MRRVTLALLPGWLVLLWQFGWGTLVQTVLAVTSALLFEAGALCLRRHPLRPGLSDGSAILTAVLLALSIPPLLPGWQTVVGSFIAIVLAKHLYGGLGFNLFNPAMVAYAALLVSFPKTMSLWPAPASPLDHPLSLLETLQTIAAGTPHIDALTAATPLDAIKSQWNQEHPDGFTPSLPAIAAGSTGVNIGFLLGGLWLLHQRLIDWRIPSGFLGGMLLTSLVAYLTDPALYPTPLFQLTAGATLLGAFFIATDPVTAATSQRGRWIYACSIGFLVAMIRLAGAYPDGVAFAVLLMNFAVPTLDHYTRPRVYGTRT